MTDKPKLSARKETQVASRPSRRAAILQGVCAMAAAPLSRAYAQPATQNYEVLQVGPGQRFASLTEAGVYMNSAERWNAGYSGAKRTAETGFHVIIHPGPPGYYVNDSGSHSRRWPKMIGWPFYEGSLLGPVIIEGAPGKPPPVLETDGNGDGVLYYQTGLFSTGSCDATFRRLVFRGFRRADGEGNYAAVRMGQTFADIPMHSQVLFEDCEFSQCDNGIMGGARGQSLTLRRCYFHDNGNGTGRCHNIYFSDGDIFTAEDTLSTRCTIGHLMKTRATKTIIRNTRLIGNGGTESACLDVPDAGVLDIAGLTCEKSPDSDAGWIIHYSGENQDEENGVPFRTPSSIDIRDLIMSGPPLLTRHSSWGPVLGFANQSGLGESASGKGSHFVAPQAQNVQVFGLTSKTAGLPCTILPQRPQIDLSSPIKL
jgi:hypothetical protein